MIDLETLASELADIIASHVESEVAALKAQIETQAKRIADLEDHATRPAPNGETPP